MEALRVTALITLVIALLAVPSTAGAAIGGGLKQLTNAKGCLVDDAATPSGCEDVRAMQGISDIVLSPGGENVYVSSIDKDAIAAFDRNPTTGELTQKSTITGCITSLAATAGPPDSCNLIGTANALTDVNAIAMSLDGANLYAVTTAGLVTVLNRDGNGTLSFNEVNNCCTGGGSSGATAVTVSPDGKSVYIAGPFFSNIVVELTRTTTAGVNLGDIVFQSCWGGVCGTAQNLGTPTDLAVMPDNKEVLIASSSNNTLLG